jgi:hypothetical protein
VTRQTLLEWVTAARSKAGHRGTVSAAYRRCSMIALPVAVSTSSACPAALAVCRAVRALWCCRRSPPSAAGQHARVRQGLWPRSGQVHRATDLSSRRLTRGHPCPPTTSRRNRSPSSRTGRRRPTSACTSSQSSRPGTSGGSARSTPSSESRRRSRAWRASSASGGTSTTGTRRETSARSSRGTSPRSTAATWPAISSCWRTRARPCGSRSLPTRCCRGSVTRCG